MDAAVPAFFLAISALFIIPIVLFGCLKSKTKDYKNSEPELQSVKRRGTSNGSLISRKMGAKKSSLRKSGHKQMNGDGRYAQINGEESAYEEPEPYRPPEDTRHSTGNPAAASPDVSVINESSPEASSRTSRISMGHSRVGSQDRALPEIPAQARSSTHSDKSPSSKRALPDLPDNVSESDHYDHLERNLPPLAKSESQKEQQLFLNDDIGRSTESLIEPDVITRNSICLRTADPKKIYSSIDEPPSTSEDASKQTKPKLKHLYTKVKKHDSIDTEDKRKSSDSLAETAPYIDGVDEDSSEPLYSEAPPVPVKLYDMDEEKDPTEGSAQDSGSGYYAVAGEPLLPNIQVSQSHVGVPESYDILTVRESIATVRARQEANQTEEDYYDSIDEAEYNNQQVAAVPRLSALASGEVYSEIDQPSGASSQRYSPHSRLYAVIDSPTTRRRQEDSAPPAPDPGYERVEFDSAKGEQTDSAGYAIVKEATGATASDSKVEDEEDYAICEPVGGPSAALRPAISNSNGYATVTFNRTAASSSRAANPAQGGNQLARPFQRYPMREHLYQEIDEVRERAANSKAPADKSK